MSDGELHAALGLHRGRRALVAVLVLALGAVGVMSVVQREPELAPVPPPPPAVELGRASSPLSQPTRKIRQRARSVIATKPVAREVPLPRPVETLVNDAAAVPAQPLRASAVVEDVARVPPAPPAEEPPQDGSVESAPPLTSEALPPAPPAEEPSQEGNGERVARAIAAEKRAAVRTCFEHELKEQPKLTGTVVVELELAPPSRVDAVRISDDLERPSFTRCVTTAMQSVRFPTLDEEISVRVPYVLTPSAK